jgi:flotillin
MTLSIESPRVYSQQGVPISVTGIAQVKIEGKNSDMLRAACEQFLGKTEEEIMAVARETLEGHQRAIIASMTVEDIYKQRKKFSKKVFEVASSDLVDMGFTVISYTIKDISDEEGYLKALGLQRTAQVKRDARIGEADAKKESMIKEAEAEENQRISRCAADAEIANALKKFEIKKAEFDQEVFTKRAMSDKAAEYQTAVTKKEIQREQMAVQLMERQMEIKIQENEAKRKQNELEAAVEKVADAEEKKLKILADAYAAKAKAEAAAESEAIRLKAVAEAAVIKAKSDVESEIMARKASAYGEYSEASRIEMVLQALPKVSCGERRRAKCCERLLTLCSI